MKTGSKPRGKKVFFALLALLVLTVVLSTGTTLGKYHKDFKKITFSTEVTINSGDIGDPTPGEGPGIEEQAPTTVYQVKPGDTLSAIAKKFHTTVEALAAYNKIKDPNVIQAGMILRIPPADYVIPKTDTEKTETGSTQPAAESAPTKTAETEPSSEASKTTEPSISPSEPIPESEPGVTSGESQTPTESQPSDGGAEDIPNDETA